MPDEPAADPAANWPAWPAFGLIDDIRPALAQAVSRRVPVAIVTLFHSEGGSPRGLGAQMAVGDGILVGHVSGGCIEADVADHCAAALGCGTSRRLVYGRGGPWDLPLPCGGRIELLIEPVPAGDEALERLVDFTARRIPCVWATNGGTRSCTAAEDTGMPEAGAIDARIYRRYDPQIRMIVVGSDPTAMAIAGIAADMGMDAVLVRPGGPILPPPLPRVRYFRDRLGAALDTIGIDRWTAVAACTHDHDLDQEALIAALRSPAFFVGALGSIRRRAERLEDLRAAGIGERDLARLKTPIGLPIGARAPYEIAVATLAEVVAAARGAGADRLRSAA